MYNNITVISCALLAIKSSICGKILSESIPKINSCSRLIKLRKLVLSVNSLIRLAIVVSAINNLIYIYIFNSHN